MRAPEVFEGFPCTDRSAIWASAATLLCWMKPEVLGLAGNQYKAFRIACCVAKLMRLFPDWTPVPSKNLDKGEYYIRETEFNLGKGFIDGEAEEIMRISSIEEELATIRMLPELKEILLHMFVLSPEQRPHPAEILKSRHFAKFVNGI